MDYATVYYKTPPLKFSQTKLLDFSLTKINCFVIHYNQSKISATPINNQDIHNRRLRITTCCIFHLALIKNRQAKATGTPPSINVIDQRQNQTAWRHCSRFIPLSPASSNPSPPHQFEVRMGFPRMWGVFNEAYNL